MLTENGQRLNTAGRRVPFRIALLPDGGVTSLPETKDRIGNDWRNGSEKGDEYAL